MNILPLVFTVLIIFSCIAFTFLKEVKSFSLIETAIHGYNRTERVLFNKISQKAYQKVKKEKEASTATGKKTEKKRDYIALRSLFPPLENSKFNLNPLLKEQGPLKLHPLYEPLANLLRLHYEKQVFKKEAKAEKLEYRLIDELVKKAQKFPDAENLAELHPDDPALRKIFYKMLKGTNKNSKDEGITPLGNILSLSKGDKAVFLCFASPTILEAFLGKEISLEIQKMEEAKSGELNKHYYVSKEDFQSIITKHPSLSPFLGPLEPFLDYSKQLTLRTQIGGRDRKTGIAVEKKLK